MKMVFPMLALAAMSFAHASFAQTISTPRYGARLEGFDYPHPVRIFAFASQDQPLEMAYLDVAPAIPNGRTVVLLHGKIFCAANWDATITEL